MPSLYSFTSLLSLALLLLLEQGLIQGFSLQQTISKFSHNVVKSLSHSHSHSSSSSMKMIPTNNELGNIGNNQNGAENKRRLLFKNTGKIVSASLASTIASIPAAANAMSNKSRSEGYEIQYSDREWSYLLSGRQYNILRQGGTERQYSSILEGEEREGKYICAGCATPLFTSNAKFHSGTGWPSYATALPGVEVEDVNPVQAGLLGAEVRCKTCGGHLGDVFNDGFIYVNTPAFVSGKRFCVDGAALVFKPSDGSEDVFGDLPPPKKDTIMPDFLSPPKISPRD